MTEEPLCSWIPYHPQCSLTNSFEVFHIISYIENSQKIERLRASSVRIEFDSMYQPVGTLPCDRKYKNAHGRHLREALEEKLHFLVTISDKVDATFVRLTEENGRVVD